MVISSGLRPLLRLGDWSGDGVVGGGITRDRMARFRSYHLLGSGSCIYSLVWL